MTIFIFLILIPTSFALQQTSGPLTINITQGEQGFASYGIRNEENETITVKLSAEGSIENYITYPKNLTIQPNELIYVNISTVISSNQTSSLNGTIYALKEGTSGGQVQLNIRLGKRISVNITPTSTNSRLIYILVISITIIILFALIHKIKEAKPK